MSLTNKMKRGILLQGKISEWTPDIVREYQKNFPFAEILVSTWIDEKIDHIPCNVIQLNPPEETHPHSSTINHQIIGTRGGLVKLHCDIIMKCRTDHFIHNSNIFNIFDKFCSEKQIMVPYEGFVLSDYYLADFCQIARSDVLLEFWNSMPLFDGSFSITPEIYFTKTYVRNIMNDKRPWKTVMKEYFCLKGYQEDFQIEWEKLCQLDSYAVKGRVKLKERNIEMPIDEYIQLTNE